MADNRLLWVFGVLIIISFLVDIGFLGTMFPELQSSVQIPVIDGDFDFGKAAVDWWNTRSGLEQNIFIYSILVVISLAVLKRIVGK